MIADGYVFVSYYYSLLPKYWFCHNISPLKHSYFLLNKTVTPIFFLCTNRISATHSTIWMYTHRHESLFVRMCITAHVQHCVSQHYSLFVLCKRRWLSIIQRSEVTLANRQVKLKHAYQECVWACRTRKSDTRCVTRKVKDCFWTLSFLFLHYYSFSHC